MDEESRIVAQIVQPVGLSVQEQDRLYEQGLQNFKLGHYARALQLWVKAAREGHGPALCDAGWLHGSGKLDKIDPVMAFRYTLASATLGYPRAQNNMGLYYKAATGCEQDLHKARMWLLRAQEANYANVALRTLEEIEAELARESGSGGSPPPLQYVSPAGRVMPSPQRQQQQQRRSPLSPNAHELDDPDDLDAGQESHRRRGHNTSSFFGADDADDEDDTSMTNPDDFDRSSVLAKLAGVAASEAYEMGLKAFAQQAYQEAALCWEHASKAGHAMAMCDLGWMVGSGTGGIPKDPVRGFELTKASAELNFARAQNNLGLYYYKGFGCDVDIAQAVHWLEVAQKAGYKKLATKTLKDAKVRLAALRSAAAELRIVDYKRRLGELKGQLDGLRKEYGIDEQQHLQAAREAGLMATAPPPPAAEEGPKVRECVICMDNMATHCLLWCMHLCVCEDCATAQYLRPGSKDDGQGQCPTCRSRIAKVKKVFF